MKKLKKIRTNIDIEINSVLAKRVIAVISLLTLMFVIVYPYFALKGGQIIMKTQTAASRTVYETIDTTAFAVRKEVLIDNAYAGTVVPAVNNGSKVAIGDTVANIYASESAAVAALRLTEIRDEIEYYKAINVSAGSIPGADINVYRSAVADSLFALSESVESDSLSSVYGLSRNLREAIMKKQSATGDEIDVSSKINTLQSEYDSLKNTAGSGSAITVSQAGYYVDSADGFESVADYDAIRSFAAADTEALLEAAPAAVSARNVGKLITDFNWYLVFNTTVDKLGTKERDSNVKVMFSNSSAEDLIMDIVSVNVTEGSDILTVVLRSNVMNEEIAALRKEAVKIRVNSVKGIAVDRMALRTIDGEQGVFVKEGNLVHFKKIKIVYTDENIVLSEPKPLDDSYLAVYDEMILEGTDLYDGKLLT
ncbi:MAG: hypothetical protein IJN70_07795 [Clostridia bacterium]|nr:hypothetical protein [Clostridia bacterium]